MYDEIRCEVCDRTAVDHDRVYCQSQQIHNLSLDKSLLDQKLDETEKEVVRLKQKVTILQNLLTKHVPAFKTIKEALSDL